MAVAQELDKSRRAKCTVLFSLVPQTCKMCRVVFVQPAEGTAVYSPEDDCRLDATCSAMANGRRTVFISFHQFSQYFGLTADDVWNPANSSAPACVTFDDDALHSPLAGKLAAHLMSIGVGVVVWADEPRWQAFMNDVNTTQSKTHLQPQALVAAEVVAQNTAGEYVLVRRAEFKDAASGS